MLRAIQLTTADTLAHNLYALILAAESVTQLPQRPDLGDVVFPDPVNSVSFYMASGTASILDQTGNEVTVIPSATLTTLGSGNFNNLALGTLQLKASAGSLKIDVSVNVN